MPTEMKTDKLVNQITSDRISDLEYNIALRNKTIEYKNDLISDLEYNIAFRNKIIEHKDDLINRYQKILIEKTPNIIYIDFTFSNS